VPVISNRPGASRADPAVIDPVEGAVMAISSWIGGVLKRAYLRERPTSPVARSFLDKQRCCRDA